MPCHVEIVHTVGNLLDTHAPCCACLQFAFRVLQVHELANPGAVYEECMNLMTRLAQLGLVHCDFNEFNLLVSRNALCGWEAEGVGRSVAVKVTLKDAHAGCSHTDLLLEGLDANVSGSLTCC